MRLRAFHRASAVVLVAYAAVHIANHLVSLAGIPAHIAFMDAARRIYRQPFAEGVLLASAAFQVASGLWLVFSRWKQRRGRVAWLQAASGAYLGFFLPVHVGAVLFGRNALDLDTNFYFAAAGFQVPPYELFFAPYYFLGVVAFFTHLGCAAYWHVRARSPAKRAAALAWPMASGCTVSLLIVLSLAGLIRPVEIPARYKATYWRADG